MTAQKKKSKKWSGGASFIKFLLGLALIVMATNFVYSFIEPETDSGSASSSSIANEGPIKAKKAASVNANSSEAKAGVIDNQAEESRGPAEVGDQEATTEDESAEAELEGEVTPSTVVDQSEAVFNAATITSSSYTITETSDTTVYNYEGDNAISVMPKSSESIVRNSLSVNQELPFTVNGHSGSQIIGQSLKDGSAITYLLITEGETMFFVRGTDEFLQEVKTNFRLK